MHFFKIFHSSIIKDKRLELPKEFTMRFGKGLSDHAIIKVPNGIWHIGLRKSEGVISFENDWKEFMEFYSICVGHVIVFRYDGNSKFKAHVFGLDATKIEYPSHINPNHEVEMISTSDEIEVIPDHFGKVEVTSIHSGSTQSNDEPFMSSEDRLNQKAKHARRKFPRKSQQQYMLARKLNPKLSHYTKAFHATLAATEEFVSENPIFKVVMQPSYIRGGYVKVPMFFASSHLTNITQKVVTLRVSYGRTWEVGYVSRTRNNRGLSQGWYKFVSDNHLKESDVCVFELVDRKRFEMNVHIFRVLQDGI